MTIFFLVSFLASIAGAICGIGGGVVIKPVLDMLGLETVTTISFLSGCTVLSMSCYSVVRSLAKGDSGVDVRTGTPLAVGAALGGLAGKQLFDLVKSLFDNQSMVGAVQAGCLTLEKLEAMTCVCSVGLDMIAIPGDISAATISGIIADEMAIGMINQKTTAVRVIPVIGKGVGQTASFGGLLGYAPIMPVNRFSCEAFVDRGGRIPAPIHSFKN